MVQIAAANPLFRDPTFEVLGPRFSLRGTSANVDGVSIKTEPIRDQTRSETVGQNVTTPGQSLTTQQVRSNLGRTSIGTDTVFEVKSGLERLDSGELSPVERNRAHAENLHFTELGKERHHFMSIGSESEDTGQTQVKQSVAFSPETAQQAALLGSLDKPVPNIAPASFVLPKHPSGTVTSGTQIDIIA